MGQDKLVYELAKMLGCFWAAEQRSWNPGQSGGWYQKTGAKTCRYIGDDLDALLALALATFMPEGG